MFRLLAKAEKSFERNRRRRVQNANRDLCLESLEDRRVLAAITDTDSVGLSQSIDIRQPYGTLNYAIALQGLFPSRNLAAEDPDPLNLTSGEQPTLGSIMQFAGNFAPRGWALCNGQLLDISTNSALFSILGTTFGGDGRTNFALPDLRGRIPVGTGSGLGLSPVALGEKIGGENVTLGVNNLPAHSHDIPNEQSTGSVGSGTPFNNKQPSLGLTPVIHLTGTIPDNSNAGSLGTIDWFAGSFPPRGTAIADGSLLSVQQNPALFSILGTIYGGDGRTTFALPDLRGRTPIHIGTGAGLPPTIIGSKIGEETNTLSITSMPSHSHPIQTSVATLSTGGNDAIFLEQPSLGVNYQIALSGIFPSRSLETQDEPSETGDSDVSGLISGDDEISLESAMAMVETLANAGIGKWIDAGITDEQAALLESVTYRIADLDHGYLASVSDHDEITIDADASNTGWFIDPTPFDHREFASTDPNTGELLATDVDALGHFDLLTTIMHEQGHILGFSHSDEPGLMHSTLRTGGRWLPEVESLIAEDHHDESESFLNAGGDPFIAQVGMFAGNFSMGGFSSTDGQTLPISQNEALFSLLGTMFGGDGRTTVGLPDLRGRAVMHPGSAPGLSSYTLGELGGEYSRNLNVNQLPAHEHSLPAFTNNLRISSVKVGSSVWDPNFRSHVDTTGGNFGYPIPTGAAQTAPLPWSHIDQVQLQFTKNIGGSFNPNLFALVGFHTQPNVVSMSYNATDFTVTITLDNFLTDDQFLLAASDLITDDLGASLDGEWTTGQASNVSGDGYGCGVFEFRFDVLPGDVDQSGDIRSNDGFTALRRLFQEVGDVNYLSFADIDGNAEILSNDGFFSLQRQFTELPKGTPVAPTFPLPVTVNAAVAILVHVDDEMQEEIEDEELENIVDAFVAELPHRKSRRW